jgi:hypothetical protein
MSKVTAWFLPAFVAFALLSGGGCATIFTSSAETVTLNSQPPGANYQFGAFSGKTPETISVPRGSLPEVATFTLDGYQAKTVPTGKSIQGATWFNILFPIGFAVDFASGNAYRLDTPNLNVQLQPTAPAAAPASGASSP